MFTAPVVSRPTGTQTGNLRRHFTCLFILGVALLAPGIGARAQPPAAAPVPAEIEGRWWGEARHGNETGEVGFEFSRKPNGRVLVREWLPNVNAYGAPIGWLATQDGQFDVPGANMPFTLKDGVITGTLWLPDLHFILRRTDLPLPTEPEPPPVPTGPAPTWNFQAGAALWATPLAADNVIYLGDAAGKFHAVGAADGIERWSYDAGAALYGTAAVDGDALYFTSDAGLLIKLARASGREIWRIDIGGAGVRSLPSAQNGDWDFLTAAPVVVDGMVYVGSATGECHALNAASGKLLWKYKTAGKLRAAAAVSDDRIYVGSMDNFVYALDRHTGALAWKFDTGSPVTTTPVITGDKLVIGTRDQALLYALATADGRKLWTVPYWLSWVESTPALADGLLYIGASDSRRVRVIEPDTGRVRWSAQVWGWTWGTPLVVGDTVYYGTAGVAQYFVTQRASLGALDRRTGALKWRKPITLSPQNYMSGIAGSLISTGGRIIVAGMDGTLCAYPAE